MDILKEVPPLVMKLDGKIDVKTLISATQTVEQLGYLKKAVDLRSYVDNSYLP